MDEEARNLMDECLATAMYATRFQTSRALGISPGDYAFRRDMLLDIPVVADDVLVAIRTNCNRQQALIDEFGELENFDDDDNNSNKLQSFFWCAKQCGSVIMMWW